MNVAMPDTAVANAVRRELDWDPKVNANSVAVRATEGSVVLTGVVCSNGEKLAAERPIQLVRGIYHVTNLITVEPRLERDDDLGDRVHAAISRMADLDVRSITAAEKNGTVHLRGSVHSLTEKRIAGHAAAAAPGVRHVNNELVVTP